MSPQHFLRVRFLVYIFESKPPAIIVFIFVIDKYSESAVAVSVVCYMVAARDHGDVSMQCGSFNVALRNSCERAAGSVDAAPIRAYATLRGTGSLGMKTARMNQDALTRSGRVRPRLWETGSLEG
jgi:hypothetical protein